MYALVLAGGKGERLRPLTDTRPKPMVELGGKPILWYQVEWLKRHGVQDVVFLVGYQAEMVKEFFGDGSAYGFRAHYSVEQNPLGRGGAIRQGLALVPSGESLVLATNGDILCHADLRAMIRQHQRMESTATVLLTRLRSPYGIVEVDENRLITNFVEKPFLPHWINGGVYVLNREIEELLPYKGDHEDSTFPMLSEQGKLGGFTSEAYWRTVDSMKDLREAGEELETFLSGLRT